MSSGQMNDQYKTKYSVKVQNVLLLNKYWSFKKVKRLRKDYGFSELLTGNLITIK